MSDTATAATTSRLHFAEHWSGRPTVAIVDLDAYASNIRALRTLVGPRVRLMAVIKANAYGHGAIPIGQEALRVGADELAVATVDEGAQLRDAGIEAPILVLGPIGDGDRARAIGQRLTINVGSASFAHALAADAKASLTKEPVSVHLKIDTGMNRFGVLPEEVVATAQAILAHPELRLDGVMSHMAAADGPDPELTHAQVARFDAAIAALREAGIETTGHHVANSATTLRFPEYHKDRVRVGIAQYGLQPDPDMPLPGVFRPILTVHSRIARVHELQPGDGVSYGFRYRASEAETVALVPIGYADGYRRNFSGKTWVTIGGERADQLGRVCMDQCVVRVPAGIDAKPGDIVTIVGNRSAATDPAPTFDDLAVMSDTISYELSCGLASRLPKLYVRGDKVVAIADLSGYRELE